MSDAFTTYALNHAPRPVAKKIRRNLAKPVYAPKTEAEKQMREGEELSARYKRLIRGEEQWLLESPAGPDIKRLIAFLDSTDLDGAENFLEQVAQCAPLHNLPKDARIIALRMIDRAIQRLRERFDLPFCDDHLDFDEPTIMQQLRKELHL